MYIPTLFAFQRSLQSVRTVLIKKNAKNFCVCATHAYACTYAMKLIWTSSSTFKSFWISVFTNFSRRLNAVFRKCKFIMIILNECVCVCVCKFAASNLILRALHVGFIAVCHHKYLTVPILHALLPYIKFNEPTTTFSFKSNDFHSGSCLCSAWWSMFHSFTRLSRTGYARAGQVRPN